jgi:DNA-binding winged helix-turn-helix (wHTH) protein
MLRQCGHCGSFFDPGDPDRTTTVGDITLALPNLLICGNGKEVSLTRTQTHLMAILMRGFMSSEAVHANLFPNSSPDTIRVHILHLRRILAAIGSHSKIDCVTGYGYKLIGLGRGNTHDEGTVRIDSSRSAHVRMRGRAIKQPKSRSVGDRGSDTLPVGDCASG